MGGISTTHTLVIPSATRYLAKVRRFITVHARQAKIREKYLKEVRLAVDEACSNVIEHAYQGKADEKLQITFTIHPTQVIICIRDRGLPFDEEAYRQPNVVELSRKRKSGGLGVDIIRRLMDHVEYSTEGNRNEIKLIKRIHNSSE